MINYVKHIRPGVWYILDHGLCKGPVGLSYNKTLECWTLKKSVFGLEETHRFFNKDYSNDAFKSYAAALHHVQTGRCLRKLETVERVSKEKPIQACGVSYTRDNRGVHKFCISNPLGGGTTVYIGTDENYTDRIEEAYYRAVDIRHGYEHEHSVKSYWDMQSCGIRKLATGVM